MAYTAFDRFVARRRFVAAAPHIRLQSRVCDLGCGTGAPFLSYIKPRLSSGTGLDEFGGELKDEKISVIQTDITAALPLENNHFDHVTMLAVLEHLVEPKAVLAEAFRILRPGGTLIMTWPSSMVDPILGILTRIGMVNREMRFDQHQPRIPIEKLEEMLRGVGFSRMTRGKFELGLNNWLVAGKDGSDGR